MGSHAPPGEVFKYRKNKKGRKIFQNPIDNYGKIRYNLDKITKGAFP